MGVKHMATYLQSRCYTRTELVCPSASCGQNLLVFDPMGCSQRYTQQTSLIWDFQTMLDNVQTDVEAFKRAGFSLIVILDAGVDEEKLQTWIRRRKGDKKAVEQLNAVDIPEVVPRTSQVWHSPLSIVEYLSQAFRANGCQVYFSVGEADHEGAWLAIAHGAYGVVSCDTDFLMYPGIKRYFDSQSIEIQDDGSIVIQQVNKEALLAITDMKEVELPAVAGICGNDFLNGQPRFLTQECLDDLGLEFRFEIAIFKLAKMCPSTWPEQCQRAMSHYKPVAPQEQTSTHLLSFVLKTKQAMMRGIGVEDLSQVSVAAVLSPLRKAIYAEYGVPMVRERICSPRNEPKSWKTWTVVEVGSDQPRAPTVSSNVQELASLACGYLLAAGALDCFHANVLVRQITDRKSLAVIMQASPATSAPVLKDVHVLALFLECVNCLSILSKDGHPLCWELLHGPLFHFLCQNPDLLDPFPAIDFEYNWYPVLEHSGVG